LTSGASILAFDGELIGVISEKAGKPYGLLGGGIENGESARDALLREVSEELNYLTPHWLWYAIVSGNFLICVNNGYVCNYIVVHRHVPGLTYIHPNHVVGLRIAPYVWEVYDHFERLKWRTNLVYDVFMHMMSLDYAYDPDLLIALALVNKATWKRFDGRFFNDGLYNHQPVLSFSHWDIAWLIGPYLKDKILANCYRAISILASPVSKLQGKMQITTSSERGFTLRLGLIEKISDDCSWTAQVSFNPSTRRLTFMAAGRTLVVPTNMRMFVGRTPDFSCSFTPREKSSVPTYVRGYLHLLFPDLISRSYLRHSVEYALYCQIFSEYGPEPVGLLKLSDDERILVEKERDLVYRRYLTETRHSYANMLIERRMTRLKVWRDAGLVNKEQFWRIAGYVGICAQFDDIPFESPYYPMFKSEFFSSFVRDSRQFCNEKTSERFCLSRANELLSIHQSNHI